MTNEVVVLSPRTATASPAPDLPGGVTGKQITTSVGNEDGSARLTAGLFSGTADRSFEWTPPQDEVIYVIEGRGTVTTDGGGSQELAAGDVVVIPRGVTAQFAFVGPWREAFVFAGPAASGTPAEV